MKLIPALVTACAMLPVYSASGPDLRVQLGHSNYVTPVEFAPDGRSVLTGSGDNTARLWDVAAGSADCTTRIWDTATGKLLATIVSFREGGWAVVDSEGRYDAADPKNTPRVYWLAGNEVTGLAKRGVQ